MSAYVSRMTESQGRDDRRKICLMLSMTLPHAVIFYQYSFSRYFPLNALLGQD